MNGYIRIGYGTDFIEYAIKPGKDEIFEIDGPGIPENEIQSVSYPSIYHLILILNKCLYGPTD